MEDLELLQEADLVSVTIDRPLFSSFNSMDIEPLPDKLFQSFSKLIYESTGIHIPENKRMMLSNRLRKRMRATGSPTFASYFALITSKSPEEIAERPHFLAAVTTGETYFFRDPQQFDWFSNEFLPERLEQSKQEGAPKELAVWSAASSSGEELYSILFTILDRNNDDFLDWKISLIGTDVSSAAIEQAKAGTFVTRSTRQISPHQRLRYFTSDPLKSLWTVRPEFQARVQFFPHNLLSPMRLMKFDCIFLKNVLIYFDEGSKKKAIQFVVDALREGGYLVVGPAEGLNELLRGLTKCRNWLFQKQSS